MAKPRFKLPSGYQWRGLGTRLNQPLNARTRRALAGKFLWETPDAKRSRVTAGKGKWWGAVWSPRQELVNVREDPRTGKKYVDVVDVEDIESYRRWIQNQQNAYKEDFDELDQTLNEMHKSRFKELARIGGTQTLLGIGEGLAIGTGITLATGGTGAPIGILSGVTRAAAKAHRVKKIVKNLQGLGKVKEATKVMEKYQRGLKKTKKVREFGEKFHRFGGTGAIVGVTQEGFTQSARSEGSFDKGMVAAGLVSGVLADVAAEQIVRPFLKKSFAGRLHKVAQESYRDAYINRAQVRKALKTGEIDPLENVPAGSQGETIFGKPKMTQIRGDRFPSVPGVRGTRMPDYDELTEIAIANAPPRLGKDMLGVGASAYAASIGAGIAGYTPYAAYLYSTGRKEEAKMGFLHGAGMGAAFGTIHALPLLVKPAALQSEWRRMAPFLKEEVEAEARAKTEFLKRDLAADKAYEVREQESIARYTAASAHTTKVQATAIHQLGEVNKRVNHIAEMGFRENMVENKEFKKPKHPERAINYIHTRLALLIQRLGDDVLQGDTVIRDPRTGQERVVPLGLVDSVVKDPETGNIQKIKGALTLVLEQDQANRDSDMKIIGTGPQVEGGRLLGDDAHLVVQHYYDMGVRQAQIDFGATIPKWSTEGTVSVIRSKTGEEPTLTPLQDEQYKEISDDVRRNAAESEEEVGEPEIMKEIGRRAKAKGLIPTDISPYESGKEHVILSHKTTNDAPSLGADVSDKFVVQKEHELLAEGLLRAYNDGVDPADRIARYEDLPPEYALGTRDRKIMHKGKSKQAIRAISEQINEFRTAWALANNKDQNNIILHPQLATLMEKASRQKGYSESTFLGIIENAIEASVEGLGHPIIWREMDFRDSNKNKAWMWTDVELAAYMLENATHLDIDPVTAAGIEWAAQQPTRPAKTAAPKGRKQATVIIDGQVEEVPDGSGGRPAQLPQQPDEAPPSSSLDVTGRPTGEPVVFKKGASVTYTTGRGAEVSGTITGISDKGTMFIKKDDGSKDILNPAQQKEFGVMLETPDAVDPTSVLEVTNLTVEEKNNLPIMVDNALGRIGEKPGNPSHRVNMPELDSAADNEGGTFRGDIIDAGEDSVLFDVKEVWEPETKTYIPVEEAINPETNQPYGEDGAVYTFTKQDILDWGLRSIDWKTVQDIDSPAWLRQRAGIRPDNLTTLYPIDPDVVTESATFDKPLGWVGSEEQHAREQARIDDQREVDAEKVGTIAARPDAARGNMLVTYGSVKGQPLSYYRGGNVENTAVFKNEFWESFDEQLIPVGTEGNKQHVVINSLRDTDGNNGQLSAVATLDNGSVMLHVAEGSTKDIDVLIDKWLSSAGPSLQAESFGFSARASNGIYKAMIREYLKRMSPFGDVTILLGKSSPERLRRGNRGLSWNKIKSDGGEGFFTFLSTEYLAESLPLFRNIHNNLRNMTPEERVSLSRGGDQGVEVFQRVVPHELMHHVLRVGVFENQAERVNFLRLWELAKTSEKKEIAEAVQRAQDDAKRLHPDVSPELVDQIASKEWMTRQHSEFWFDHAIKLAEESGDLGFIRRLISIVRGMYEGFIEKMRQDASELESPAMWMEDMGLYFERITDLFESDNIKRVTEFDDNGIPIIPKTNVDELVSSNPLSGDEVNKQVDIKGPGRPVGRERGRAIKDSAATERMKTDFSDRFDQDRITGEEIEGMDTQERRILEEVMDEKMDRLVNEDQKEVLVAEIRKRYERYEGEKAFLATSREAPGIQVEPKDVPTKAVLQMLARMPYLPDEEVSNLSPIRQGVFDLYQKMDALKDKITEKDLLDKITQVKAGMSPERQASEDARLIAKMQMQRGVLFGPLDENRRRAVQELFLDDTAELAEAIGEALDRDIIGIDSQAIRDRLKLARPVLDDGETPNRKGRMLRNDMAAFASSGTMTMRLMDHIMFRIAVEAHVARKRGESYFPSEDMMHVLAQLFNFNSNAEGGTGGFTSIQFSEELPLGISSPWNMIVNKMASFHAQAGGGIRSAIEPQLDVRSTALFALLDMTFNNPHAQMAILNSTGNTKVSAFKIMSDFHNITMGNTADLNFWRSQRPALDFALQEFQTGMLSFPKVAGKIRQLMAFDPAVEGDKYAGARAWLDQKDFSLPVTTNQPNETRVSQNALAADTRLRQRRIKVELTDLYMRMNRDFLANVEDDVDVLYLPMKKDGGLGITLLSKEGMAALKKMLDPSYAEVNEKGSDLDLLRFTMALGNDLRKAKAGDLKDASNRWIDYVDGRKEVVNKDTGRVTPGIVEHGNMLWRHVTRGTDESIMNPNTGEIGGDGATGGIPENKQLKAVVGSEIWGPDKQGRSKARNTILSSEHQRYIHHMIGLMNDAEPEELRLLLKSYYEEMDERFVEGYEDLISMIHVFVEYLSGPAMKDVIKKVNLEGSEDAITAFKLHTTHEALEDVLLNSPVANQLMGRFEDVKDLKAHIKSFVDGGFHALAIRGQSKALAETAEGSFVARPKTLDQADGEDYILGAVDIEGKHWEPGQTGQEADVQFRAAANTIDRISRSSNSPIYMPVEGLFKIINKWRVAGKNWMQRQESTHSIEQRLGEKVLDRKVDSYENLEAFWGDVKKWWVENTEMVEEWRKDPDKGKQYLIKLLNDEDLRGIIGDDMFYAPNVKVDKAEIASMTQPGAAGRLPEDAETRTNLNSIIQRVEENEMKIDKIVTHLISPILDELLDTGTFRNALDLERGDSPTFIVPHRPQIMRLVLEYLQNVPSGEVNRTVEKRFNDQWEQASKDSNNKVESIQGQLDNAKMNPDALTRVQKANLENELQRVIREGKYPVHPSALVEAVKHALLAPTDRLRDGHVELAALVDNYIPSRENFAYDDVPDHWFESVAAMIQQTLNDSASLNPIVMRQDGDLAQGLVRAISRVLNMIPIGQLKEMSISGAVKESFGDADTALFAQSKIGDKLLHAIQGNPGDILQILDTFHRTDSTLWHGDVRTLIAIKDWLIGDESILSHLNDVMKQIRKGVAENQAAEDGIPRADVLFPSNASFEEAINYSLLPAKLETMGEPLGGKEGMQGPTAQIAGNTRNVSISTKTYDAILPVIAGIREMKRGPTARGGGETLRPAGRYSGGVINGRHWRDSRLLLEGIQTGESQNILMTISPITDLNNNDNVVQPGIIYISERVFPKTEQQGSLTGPLAELFRYAEENNLEVRPAGGTVNDGPGYGERGIKPTYASQYPEATAELIKRGKPVPQFVEEVGLGGYTGQEVYAAILPAMIRGREQDAFIQTMLHELGQHPADAAIMPYRESGEFGLIDHEIRRSSQEATALQEQIATLAEGMENRRGEIIAELPSVGAGEEEARLRFIEEDESVRGFRTQLDEATTRLQEIRQSNNDNIASLQGKEELYIEAQRARMEKIYGEEMIIPTDEAGQLDIFKRRRELLLDEIVTDRHDPTSRSMDLFLEAMRDFVETEQDTGESPRVTQFFGDVIETVYQARQTQKSILELKENEIRQTIKFNIGETADELTTGARTDPTSVVPLRVVAEDKAPSRILQLGKDIGSTLSKWLFPVHHAMSQMGLPGELLSDLTRISTTLSSSTRFNLFGDQANPQSTKQYAISRLNETGMLLQDLHKWTKNNWDKADVDPANIHLDVLLAKMGLHPRTEAEDLVLIKKQLDAWLDQDEAGVPTGEVADYMKALEVDQTSGMQPEQFFRDAVEKKETIIARLKFMSHTDNAEYSNKVHEISSILQDLTDELHRVSESAGIKMISAKTRQALGGDLAYRQRYIPYHPSPIGMETLLKVKTGWEALEAGVLEAGGLSFETFENKEWRPGRPVSRAEFAKAFDALRNMGGADLQKGSTPTATSFESQIQFRATMSPWMSLFLSSPDVSAMFMAYTQSSTNLIGEYAAAATFLPRLTLAKMKASGVSEQDDPTASTRAVIERMFYKPLAGEDYRPPTMKDVYEALATDIGNYAQREKGLPFERARDNAILAVHRFHGTQASAEWNSDTRHVNMNKYMAAIDERWDERTRGLAEIQGKEDLNDVDIRIQADPQFSVMVESASGDLVYSMPYKGTFSEQLLGFYSSKRSASRTARGLASTAAVTAYFTQRTSVVNFLENIFTAQGIYGTRPTRPDESMMQAYVKTGLALVKAFPMSIGKVIKDGFWKQPGNPRWMEELTQDDLMGPLMGRFADTMMHEIMTGRYTLNPEVATATMSRTFLRAIGYELAEKGSLLRTAYVLNQRWKGGLHDTFSQALLMQPGANRDEYINIVESWADAIGVKGGFDTIAGQYEVFKSQAPIDVDGHEWAMKALRDYVVTEGTLEIHHRYGALDMPPAAHEGGAAGMFYWLRSWQLQQMYRMLDHNLMKPAGSFIKKWRARDYTGAIEQLAKDSPRVAMQAMTISVGAGAMTEGLNHYLYRHLSGRDRESIMAPDGTVDLEVATERILENAFIAPPGSLGALSMIAQAARETMHARDTGKAITRFVMSPLISYGLDFAGMVRQGWDGFLNDNPAAKRSMGELAYRTMPFSGVFRMMGAERFPPLKDYVATSRRIYGNLRQSVYPESPTWDQSMMINWTGILQKMNQDVAMDTNGALNYIMRVRPDQAFQLFTKGWKMTVAETRKFTDSMGWMIAREKRDKWKKLVVEAAIAKQRANAPNNPAAEVLTMEADHPILGFFYDWFTERLRKASPETRQRFLWHMSLGSMVHASQPSYANDTSMPNLSQKNPVRRVYELNKVFFRTRIRDAIARSNVADPDFVLQQYIKERTRFETIREFPEIEELWNVAMNETAAYSHALMTHFNPRLMSDSAVPQAYEKFNDVFTRRSRRYLGMIPNRDKGAGNNAMMAFQAAIRDREVGSAMEQLVPALQDQALPSILQGFKFFDDPDSRRPLDQLIGVTILGLRTIAEEKFTAQALAEKQAGFARRTEEVVVNPLVQNGWSTGDMSTTIAP